MWGGGKLSRHSNFSCWGMSVMVEAIYSFPLVKATQLTSQGIPRCDWLNSCKCVYAVVVPELPRVSQQSTLRSLRALALAREWLSRSGHSY